MLLLFKPKVLNAINKICKSRKRPDDDSIIDYIIKTEASNVDKPLLISITNELINQNLIENKKTRQGLDSFHLVKLSDAGNILNNFVNSTPPLGTSTTDILQPLHPKAVENTLPDATFTNTDAPMLKSTKNQQNGKLLQETPVLKSTQNQQIVNFLQESSQTPLKAELFALKCLIKDELNDICETIEKISQKLDQSFYREYNKNLWDEIA